VNRSRAIGPEGTTAESMSNAPETARHLLVVTYHFPPIQSAGVYRLVGLVKYLRERGWRITVLTVRRSSLEASDDASLELIPEGISVVRTDSIEPAARLLRAAEARNTAAAGTTSDRPTGAPARRNPLRRALAGPWGALVRALSYPDHQVGWAPRVARDVAAFARRHPGAVVLSSTPPHSTHLGVRVARAFARFGWVADFRDPWTSPLRQPKGKSNLAFQLALERWVLLGCDRVIANTNGNREALLAAFPRLDPSRVSVIPNAFDTDTMPEAAPADDPALACDIAYFGEVYPGMLDAYLDALRILVARDPHAAPRLHVFGRVGAGDVRRVHDQALSSHIAFMGIVSYARSLSLMRAARSLLLLLPDGESMATCVPSKLYPYLFTGRPIFALVPPGDAARVVEETASGEVVAPGDPALVADRMAAFVARVRKGTAVSLPRGEATAAYAMDRAARRVHDILDEAAPRG
jgi:glycosyltransferase involved in cell wall biosynthesis